MSASPFSAKRAGTAISGSSVILRVECSGKTTREVDRRVARVAGSVHFESPSRLIDPPNDRASLLKRRRAYSKVEGMDTSSLGLAFGLVDSKQGKIAQHFQERRKRWRTSTRHLRQVRKRLTS